jgi:hypothetical protein
METQQIIELAAQHQEDGAMSASAQICLADAVWLMSVGNESAARRRALKSLQYSVGVFHPDFQQAQA